MKEELSIIAIRLSILNMFELISLPETSRRKMHRSSFMKGSENVYKPGTPF
jgi:hypothetical protein